MATFTTNDRPALTGANSAADDYFLIWDTSAGTHKKISRAELLAGLLSAGATAASFLGINAAAGVSRVLRWTASGALRFSIECNNVAEGGSDTGSDLGLVRYNDAGSFVAVPLYIRRSDGRVTADGAWHFSGVGTTASAANAVLDAGSSPANNLLRSTSSEAYKKDIEPLESWRADKVIEEAAPIWYRSLAPADNPDWGWYGLTAEQMAEVDPRLVNWGYRDADYDTIPIFSEVEEEQRQTGVERVLKEGAVKVPDGVAYERLTVMLLDVVRREKAKVAALEATVVDLLARVEALESA